MGNFGKMLKLMARTSFTRQLRRLGFNPLSDIDDPMAEIVSYVETGRITPSS